MKKFLIIVLFLALFLFSGCQRTKPVQQTRPAESAKPVEEVDSLKSTPQTEEKAVLPPRQVVEAFIKTTLGTVPGAEVDYDYAKKLMTADYRAEFKTPMFVPQTYGIQDGPTNYQFKDEEITGNTAMVTVLGLWGTENQMYWQFELEKEKGEWKVSFINPGQ